MFLKTLQNRNFKQILYRFYSHKAVRYFSTENIVADAQAKTTHFGFETVTEKEKEEKVHKVFENVAGQYDLMNDIMSGGIHRLWKDYFIWRMSPAVGTRLIDVAGGTGDIAFRFLEYVKNSQLLETTGEPSNQVDINSVQFERPDWSESEQFDSSDDEKSQKGVTKRNSKSAGSADAKFRDTTEHDAAKSDGASANNTHVTVCDINQAMLDVGRRKARDLGVNEGISWLLGNAEALEVADNSYDIYSVAFGIRNMTHIDRVLSEAYRVLKPGGRFMCLEFSQVNNRLIRSIYDEYSFQVIPVMGKIVAGDWKSYQYLVESIRRFPNQDEFKSMIRESGFNCVQYENLFGGVAAIHSGFKL